MSDRSIIPIAAALLFAGACMAATNSQPREIEVVVTANRDAREAVKVPANITVVTGDEIAEAGDVSIVDALKNLDGVSFRSTSGNASSAQISMRGFGENSHGRVLVLRNGRRLNTPDMAGIDWLQIPLSDIDRVEVVRGSSSALYGNYAVGGVVNIITKAGTPEPSFSAAALAGSYGMNAERMGYSDSCKMLSYSLNAERSEIQGYRKRSRSEEWGGGGNLSYDLGDRFNDLLSLSYDDNAYELPGGLSKAQMDEDPRQSLFPNDSANMRHVNVDNSLRLDLAEDLRGDLDLFFGRKTLRNDVESWASFADSVIDTYGAAPRLIFDRRLGDHANNLLAGIDYYRDVLDVDLFSDGNREVKTSSAHLRRETLGYYVHDEFSAADTLILGLGARTESATVDTDLSAPSATATGDRVTQHVHAYDASLVKVLDDNSKVFAKAGTVYRYPFVDEQVSYIGFGSDQLFTDIKPEKGRNFEVGTELSPFKAFKTALTVFLLDMRDEIAWNNITMRNENMEETRHKGAEARIEYLFEHICNLNASYTYTKATFTEGEFTGNDVPLVPNQRLTLGVDVFLPAHVTAGATANYVSDAYLGEDKANSGEKLQDHTTVDLSLKCAPRFLRGLQTNVGVENVFDKHYADLAYKGLDEDAYYPANGRAFKAGVLYKF